MPAVQAGTTSAPDGSYFGGDPNNALYAAPDGSVMLPGMVRPSGGNQPHNNLMPYQAINFIISLAGIYPSQN